VTAYVVIIAPRDDTHGKNIEVSYGYRWVAGRRRSCVSSQAPAFQVLGSGLQNSIIAAKALTIWKDFSPQKLNSVSLTPFLTFTTASD
jgi:hypothetical protein